MPDIVQPANYTALLWTIVVVLSTCFTIVVAYLKARLDSNEKKCNEDRLRAEKERDLNHKATMAFAKVMLKVSEKLGCDYEDEIMIAMGIESGPHEAVRRVNEESTRIFRKR